MAGPPGKHVTASTHAWTEFQGRLTIGIRAARLTVARGGRQAGSMSSEVVVEKRKLPVVKLAIVAVAVLVGAALMLRGVDLRALVERGMALVREMGPWVFFSVWAFVPGAPNLVFAIPAGEAFAPRMGMGGVIAAALTALAINLALAYWLSRYALRPLLTRLLQRYGYSVPRVTSENALNVALLVRLTPGPPYILQCAALGIAEVPFRLYMIVSFCALLPWVLGALVLGQGLFQGNFKVAASGLGVLVVAVIAVQWVRRKYFTKREG